MKSFAWKLLTFSLVSVALRADSITWNGDLTGNGGPAPTATSDGFTINVNSFGYAATVANQSAAESFTVTTAGTFLFTETAALNFSGYNCNPGFCPDSLSGFYNASSNFGSGLSDSKMVSFPTGITLEMFTLSGSESQQVALDVGTYVLNSSLFAQAGGGDPDIYGTYSVSFQAIPEPRGEALCLIAALMLCGAAARRWQRKRCEV